MTVYTQIGQQNPDYTLMSGPPQVATLLTMAQSIMTRLENLARTEGIDLPGRHVIYMTPLPADCPQVGVLFSGWQTMGATEGMVVCQTFRWVGRFTIYITRKTPAIPREDQPPTPEQMFKAAALGSADAELLISLLQTFGEINGDAQIETLSAEGGLQSTVASVLLAAFGGLD